MQDNITTALALLRLQYALTDESDRIDNPERNDQRYYDYCEAITKGTTFVENVKGKLEARDPDFPCECHLMEIYVPTENPDLDITMVKGKLADIINSADEVGMGVDERNQIYIYLGWNDIYTPREA